MPLPPLESIVEKARSIKADLVTMRRHIHAHPELSFKEEQTAAYVAEQMKTLGYRVKHPIARTGLTAEIGEGDIVIGIRADMDALPIKELNPESYCSRNEGVMHACGHDAHTAAALGAARLIADIQRDCNLPARFRFIFQPAEESINEEGLSGASLMMKDGCLDELKALLAIHVHPGMPTGTYGFRQGTFLAACDSFHIMLKGRGGHGAHPEDTVDAVVMAANFVQSLQTLISRRKSALAPAVLTVGGIRSNTFRPNIVAEEVELTGTIRYFDPELSPFFESEILKLQGLLEPYGATMRLKYNRENPALINDSRLTASLKETAACLVNKECLLDLPLELGSEDFSFYTDTVPSVFAIVGCGLEGQSKEIHTADFDIDEDSLVFGTAILTAGALKFAQGC